MRQSTKAPNIMAKNDVHLRQAFQLQILWNAFYNWSGTRHRYLKKFVTELPAVPVRGFQLSEHALSSSEKEVVRRNWLLTKWMSWGWYTRRPLYSPSPTTASEQNERPDPIDLPRESSDDVAWILDDLTDFWMFSAPHRLHRDGRWWRLARVGAEANA